MRVRIKKGLPSGCFNAPPSKSYAHRLLICSALSGGECSVSNVSRSEDVYATIDCIRALGTEFSFSDGKICFEKNDLKKSNNIFSCRESGSTLRFMIPIALSRGGAFEFRGAKRLIDRGISVYEDVFRNQGISVRKCEDAINFEGKLKPGIFEVRGDISSQFITGLLFALPMLDSDSTVRVTTELESRPYIDITVDCLSRFGIEIREDKKNEFIGDLATLIGMGYEKCGTCCK